MLRVLALAAAIAAPASSPLATIDARLSALARQDEFSGVVLVAKDGRPVLERAYGFANRTRHVRNSVDTKFNLASVGKTFTAVAVAQLVEQGKVSFADTIGRYVPELPPAVRKRITIAELLDHTSGLGDFFAHPRYPVLRHTLTSLERYLPLIVDVPPSGTPGARFSYSNSGYILLGLVVQRASGLDYYDYIERNVFARAGMRDTGCFLRSARVPNLAIGYTGPKGARQPNTAGLPPRGSSAGGCYSTAPDLLRFSRALLSGRLVDRRLVRTITTGKVAAPGGKYGYGFGVRYGRPGDPPTFGHNGGAPGVATELAINPGLGYTVIVLGNLDPPVIEPAVGFVLDTLHIP